MLAAQFKDAQLRIIEFERITLQLMAI